MVPVNPFWNVQTLRFELEATPVDQWDIESLRSSLLVLCRELERLESKVEELNGQELE